MPQNPLQLLLESLHHRFATLRDGSVANYIPELGRADPTRFGIAITTADGHLYSAGDSDFPFTIQSISKPLLYGLALDDRGEDHVRSKVDVEPSGEAFNAISLEPGSGRPRNPMINAGAITVASLVDGEESEGRWARVLAMLSAYAGRTLDLDEAVFTSELLTGHRNRAIGHLLRNAGIFDEDVDDVCARYFRQCSVRVTCEDLAMMAATLANDGVNPRTGDRAIAPENVERVLSVMSTCGMYDGAGSWMYRVGMPAKSGVGGGILAVLPGQLGIGVYSPPLDPSGNSVRGVAVCEELSREFGLHVLRPPVSPRSALRAAFRLSDLPSKRRRTAVEATRLESLASTIQIVQLQGPLVLSTAEVAIREVLTHAQPGSATVFDLKRTAGIDPSVCRLLGVLSREVVGAGGAVAFAPLAPDDRTATAIVAASGDGAESALRFFSDVDRAIQWCEDRELTREGLQPSESAEMALAEHPLLAGLDAGQLAAMGAISERIEVSRGQRIITAESIATVFYLVVAGVVEVSVTSPSGQHHLLATQGAGTAIGELALLDAGGRTANVDAATDVVCYAVRVDGVAAAEPDAPGLRLKLIEALARDLADRLRRANREIAVLAS